MWNRCLESLKQKRPVGSFIGCISPGYHGKDPSSEKHKGEGQYQWQTRALWPTLQTTAGKETRKKPLVKHEGERYLVFLGVGITCLVSFPRPQARRRSGSSHCLPCEQLLAVAAGGAGVARRTLCRFPVDGASHAGAVSAALVSVVSVAAAQRLSYLVGTLLNELPSVSPRCPGPKRSILPRLQDKGGVCFHDHDVGGPGVGLADSDS